MTVSCLVNAAPAIIFLGLWIVGNLALFAYTFWKYQAWDEYYYLRTIVGFGSVFARASAAAINLNMALILLPVCRNLISFLRGSCPCYSRRAICRSLDYNILFHKLCAYSICFWTVIHYFGHTFNIERFVEAAKNPLNLVQLKYKLSSLPDQANGTWLNPVRSNNTNPLEVAVTILSGSTGIIGVLVLVLMVASSTETVRRSCYELFWFTHHLFIVFFAVIMAHDTGGLGRSMNNLSAHNITLCKDKFTMWNEWKNGVLTCPDPEFTPSTGKTWMWVIGPLTIYLVERLVRFARGFRKVKIVKVVRHPSNVLELQMKMSRFSMTSGQYIFINCPQVARFQWHPFTLTSAPEEEFFSVHIRVVGDWTRAVSDACVKAGDNMNEMPRFSIDGPFGTCSEDVFNYDIAMLVGAGIGVTPFASILKHIWFVQSSGEKMQLQKVYFFWICPETNAFSWFVDLLEALEKQLKVSRSPDFLDIQIFWTRGWTQSQRNAIVESVDETSDAITGLQHKTKFGRPQWDLIFSQIQAKHSRDKIGVFFCGPEAMSKTLQKMSSEYSSINPTETRFVYHKENF